MVQNAKIAPKNDVKIKCERLK